MSAASSQSPIDDRFIEQLLSANSDLTLAHRLADRADQISLSRYQSLDLVVETKPDTTPVTDADRAVEKEIRALLSQERADDLIIGEEFGGVELLESASPGKRFWIIDPIDGTKNFLRAVPTWATLIAMGIVTEEPERYRIVLGVVSSPALGRRWWAQQNHGAFVTENFNSASPLGDVSSPQRTRRISVSKVSQIADASISFSDLVGWGSRKGSFLSLLDDVWRTRALGDFLSHMLVAEGAVDIAAEPSLALWDMAALAIIVTEAGGRYSSLDGVNGPFGASGVSSNGYLHGEFLKRVSVS